MNEILLIDVDSKIPNIALMKLSTFYKAQGYKIIFRQLNYDYYEKDKKLMQINSKIFEKVFVSIVFNVNKNVLTFNDKSNVSVGGSGYDLEIKLPDEIENIKDYDYSLYEEEKTSYGFLTRGCIRKCSFCVVPKKEGMIHQVNNVDDIFKFKQIKFLDNNFLAFDKHKEILKELIEKKIKFQFNQGLDIRLLDDENSELLSKCTMIEGNVLFAFDDIKSYKLIDEQYKMFRKYFKNDWRAKFFIYCHPKMNIQEEVLPRINYCKDNKALPYFMRDLECYSSKLNNFYTDLASYCNQPIFFKTHTFEEYLNKRHSKSIRIKSSLKIYKGE